MPSQRSVCQPGARKISTPPASGPKTGSRRRTQAVAAAMRSSGSQLSMSLQKIGPVFGDRTDLGNANGWRADRSGPEDRTDLTNPLRTISECETPSCRRRSRRLRAVPRCAAAGCTWPCGRERAGAPVLIWPVLKATTKSAMVAVLALAGAVGRDHGPAGALAHVHGGDRLGQGADLVDLAQQRVADLLLDGSLDALDVGHQQVIAHELHRVSRSCRRAASSRPSRPRPCRLRG